MIQKLITCTLMRNDEQNPSAYDHDKHYTNNVKSLINILQTKQYISYRETTSDNYLILGQPSISPIFDLVSKFEYNITSAQPYTF